MNIEKAIRDYLPNVIHMSLATSANNKPWVCEVHYVFDDELNFYFLSTQQSRHSIEILSNPHIAGNIITQHELGQNVRGVYFEGLAVKLENVTKDHVAYQLYCERFGVDESILDEAKEETGHIFYKVIVKNFSLFDGCESNPGTKYELDWK